jgi:hypothetical protein
MEKEISWDDLESADQVMVITAYCQLLKTEKSDIMLRIFNLGNPKIVIGQNGENAYCRVHKDSVDIIKLLIRQYL